VPVKVFDDRVTPLDFTLTRTPTGTSE
jgi:hypothetical protein